MGIMTDYTRRGVLSGMAAGTATLTGLSGCLDGDNSANKNNSSQEGDGNNYDEPSIREQDPFYLLNDPITLQESGAVSGSLEGRTFLVEEASDVYKNVDEEVKEAVEEDNLGETYMPDNADVGDIVTTMSDLGGIETYIYSDDISEEDLQSRFESLGIEPYEGDMETYGWSVYHDSTPGIMTATKNNNAVIIFDQEPINDLEAAMQVTLDNYEGERDSFLDETDDDFGSRSLARLVDHLRNGDLGIAEGAQRFYGSVNNFEEPRTETEDTSIVVASRFEGNTRTGKIFKVDQDLEVHGGEEVEEELV